MQRHIPLLLLIGLTAVGPWLGGSLAVLRLFMLVVTPGLATLLLLSPGAVRPGARGVAAVTLVSAIIAPVSWFFLFLLFGSLNTSLVVCALLWASLLAVGVIFGRWMTVSGEVVHAERREILLAAGIVCVIAAPLLLNPELRVRSDAWSHIAYVRSIARGDYPWTDPRFAGEPLRYFWFFNFWSAGFVVRSGLSPASALTLCHLSGIVVFVSAMVAMTRSFFETRRQQAAGLLAVAVALNPFGLLGIVTHFARALVGEVTGWAEIKRVLGSLHFGDASVVYALAPYGTTSVSWIDKFLVVGAFGFGMGAAAVASMTTWRILRSGRVAWRDWVVLSLSLAAAMFYHFVVGVAVTLLLGAAVIAVAVLGRSSLRTPEALRVLSASLPGLVLSIPYYYRIFAGREGSVAPVTPGIQAGWLLTAAVTLGPLAALIFAGRRSLRDRGFPSLVPMATILTLTFAAVTLVPLPSTNENKFILLGFLLCAPLGGPGLLRIQAWARERLWRRVVGLVLFGSACLVPLLIWVGFLLQPGETVSSGAEEAARWIREETPSEAVVIEPVGPHFALNRAARDVYVSDWIYVLECGYSRERMRERTELVADLYRGDRLSEEQISRLRGLERPVYALFLDDWLRDGLAVGRPDSTIFDLAYENEDAEVYRLTGEPTARPEPPRP
jgi:hypothetical protein